MTDSDETQPASDCDEDVHSGEEDDCEGISRVTKSRRANVPDWGLDGPRSMAFNKKGKAVGEGAGKLSRFIGQVGRDHSLLPLDCDNWRHMDGSRLKIAWQRVKETILWTEEQRTDKELMGKIKKVVLCQLNDRWKYSKIRYREKYYTPNIGNPDRFKPPDKSIDPCVWRRAVEYWDSAGYNAIREVNKKNAAVPRMHHTTGTLNFGQVEHDYEKENGKKVDRLTLLKLCYTRNDGSLIDDQAKKAIDDIENVLHQMPQDEQDTVEGRNAAFEQVLGNRDRNGRLFGGGLGVRTSNECSTSTGNGKLSDVYIEALTKSITEKCEKDYQERLAKAEMEIEERITKKIEEQLKKKAEEEQARNIAEIRQHLLQMSPEPSWLNTRMLETGYSSQTQGNFQHMLSQNTSQNFQHMLPQNTSQMHQRYMMSHQGYPFHESLFPPIHQPTFDQGGSYFPTPPQRENAKQNGNDEDEQEDA